MNIFLSKKFFRRKIASTYYIVGKTTSLNIQRQQLNSEKKTDGANWAVGGPPLPALQGGRVAWVKLQTLKTTQLSLESFARLANRIRWGWLFRWNKGWYAKSNSFQRLKRFLGRFKHNRASKIDVTPKKRLWSSSYHLLRKCTRQNSLQVRSQNLNLIPIFDFGRRADFIH